MSRGVARAGRLPVLFLSHGSPLFALEPGEVGPALTRWVQAHAPETHVRAVVILSPHWMTHGVGVMAHPQPETWHDFGGFPAPLYDLQYPAPGEPALAAKVLQCLQAAQWPSGLDPERPFDHGAWVPLMGLYPEARVPVVQMSLPVRVNPAGIYALGQALAPLRDQGVLLIGSGGMTHNLREERGPLQASVLPYVPAFSRWVEERLMSADTEALFDYRARAPHAARAHPTDEHFLPMYFALGAAGWGTEGGPLPRYITRDVHYGFLAMDAFSLH